MGTSYSFVCVFVAIWVGLGGWKRFDRSSTFSVEVDVFSGTLLDTDPRRHLFHNLQVGEMIANDFNSYIRACPQRKWAGFTNSAPIQKAQQRRLQYNFSRNVLAQDN